MTKALDKLNVEKKNLYTTVLMSVSSAVIVILIFYFLFFYGQINCEYTVTNSKIDNVMVLSKNENVSLYVNKPFNRIFLPISLCNTDNVTITISDDNSVVTNSITVDQDTVLHNDLNDNIDFWTDYSNNYDYYRMEGVELNTDKLANEFVISIDCNRENGFILLGKQGDSIAYKTIRDTNINYWIFFLISFILVLGTGIVSYDLLHKVNIIKNYTLIATVIGLIYFILLPAPCTNDSKIHIIESYRRASNILGHSDWNNIDGDYNRFMYKAEDGYILHNTLWNTERIYPLPDTKMYDEAMYSSFIDISNEEIVAGQHATLSDVKTISYLPYTIILAIARLLNMNLRIGLGIAKLAGFLCYLFMIRLAIKLMPYGKETLALFSLTPMMLQSMVSISYDLFCIGGSFIAFAYVLKMGAEEHRFTWKDVVLFCFLAIVLGSVKGGIYFACFAFMVFFLKVFPAILKNKKYLILFILVMMAIGGLVILKFNDIFNLVITDNTINYSVLDLIENPIQMVRFILSSMIKDADILIQGMFGGRLGWNEEVVPWFTVIAFVILFIISCNTDDGKFPREEKKYSIIAMVLFTFGIYVIFLRTTGKEQPFVFGLQGRYFIPLIPLVICFLNNHKLKLNCKPNLLFNSLWFVSIIHILFVMTVYLRR